MSTPEIQTKMNRLAEFLARHKLDGVLFTHRNNFAWITCGRDNHILGSSQNGVASILATADARLCFTNSIEAVRYETEELVGTGVDVIQYPWHDKAAGQRTLKEIIAGRKIAADVDDVGEFDRFGAGLHKLPHDFAQLRWSLTSEEISRYREGGRRTSAAMEKACHRIRHNMSEFQIAGLLDEEVRGQGLHPVVTLVAADQRVDKYRHPIPTEQRATKYAMLVTCSSFGGLISNMTRFVSFAPLSEQTRKKQQAVVNVDVAANLATRPGRTLGQMFAVIEKSYADNGYPGECQNHHQGGSTGYAGREAFAEPGSSIKILENQAFAWNPSLTGVKSEDTILCTAEGIEFLTVMSKDWPRVEGHLGEETLERPDILVRA